ncbi:MAG TPA: sulfurtransferase [Ktedonobacteraceae bacterium]|jgi:thiosulfate/3-mercaptopyruvate sulfurtransferase|nr:sulfurtransferase [Ktedonobacteraceae bacterium]
MPDFVTHPLVEPSWVAVHLTDSDVRIVDARWRGDGSGRELYRRGHIPGAVHLDWQHDLSRTDERGVGYLLLPPEQFAEVMEAVGIGDQTRVIAYAETDHSGAARLWWALRYYGHEQVAVLNGGWNRWVAEGLPISTAETRSVPASFTPRPQPRWLAQAREIEQALREADSRVCLVDTRPAEQYAGHAIWTPHGSLFLPSGQSWIALVDGRVMRGGHIPGAVHLHASRFLDPVDWTYLSHESILALAQEVGLNPEQRIITYCGSGISASLALLALYLGGYRDIALYDASWEEWGTDPDFPIE